MLKTVFFSEQFHKERDCVILLGGFDGLHVGHKKLISRAKKYALPVGIMTIAGGKDGESLFTLSERERLFKEAGADFAFELLFEEIKELSSDEFAALLIKEFSVKAFVCGDDFRFGKGASGTPQFLKEATHVSVETVDLVKINGKKVSSSDIKAFLEAGETEKANALLEENFFLVGTVVKDRQVGRTLGFPTANIFYPNGKFPLKKGVYESRVFLDGKTYKGITNYGARPTFGNETVLTETYLDGFEGDLYDRELKVEFVRFLRGVKKFESVFALKEQLREDIRRVRGND